MGKEVSKEKLEGYFINKIDLMLGEISTKVTCLIAKIEIETESCTCEIVLKRSSMEDIKYANNV